MNESARKSASSPSGDAPDEHSVFKAAVGEAIRRARHGHGWTQASLAEQTGLSPNYIARLERGELGPSLFVAARIAEALGSSLDDLVGPTGSSARRPGAKPKALAG